MPKLVQGQLLWWVPARARNDNPREVAVTKVGRVWVQLSNQYRIDIDTLVADGAGYSPPGRCYLSREEYEAQAALQAAWHALRMDISAKVPDGVTIADIESARRMLRM